MGLWDMLSTTPKEKTRKRNDRSVTPNPSTSLFNGASDEPSSAASVAAELEVDKKVPGDMPLSPTSNLSKRKNMESVKEEGSKRLRSGTVIQKNGTNGTTGNGANPKPVDFPEPHPLLSSSQFSTRSPVNRLSMSVSGGRPPSVLGYSVDELDNDTIEKLLAARTAADKAELKARNELHHALVALEDRRSQRSEAEADVEAKDEEIADLQKRLEKARSERDELADKLAHVSNHVTAAENTYSECSRKVIAATAASKNAQRDYSLAVRGE